jgi:hypothetical protein
MSTTTRESLPGFRARGTTTATARWSAALAAGVFLANGVIGLVGNDVSDHSTGAGLLSELTAGLGFLAAAVALALLTPVTGWRRLLWWLAPSGLTVAGLTMVGVTVIGSEPAEWLFVVAVLPTFVGLLAAAVLGTGRAWPWWTGLGLALFLPVMFLLPFNAFVMALVWLLVAATARARCCACSSRPSGWSPRRCSCGASRRRTATGCAPALTRAVPDRR